MSALSELLGNVGWMIHDLSSAGEITSDEEEKLMEMLSNSKEELSQLRADLAAAVEALWAVRVDVLPFITFDISVDTIAKLEKVGALLLDSLEGVEKGVAE